jgi:hypothetical protein
MRTSPVATYEKLRDSNCGAVARQSDWSHQETVRGKFGRVPSLQRRAVDGTACRVGPRAMLRANP